MEPQHVRDWFNEFIRNRRYSGIVALTEELNRRTGKQFSKSTVGRYVRELKLRDKMLPPEVSGLTEAQQHAIFRLGLALVDVIQALGCPCAPGAEHDQP
jgi:hypothetical protein